MAKLLFLQVHFKQLQGEKLRLELSILALKYQVQYQKRPILLLQVKVPDLKQKRQLILV